MKESIVAPKKIYFLWKYEEIGISQTHKKRGTPDMHIIHHSQLVNETNSNYGFSLSCWDKLFGTYKQSAEKEQTEIDIGLKEYRDYKKTGLLQILAIPFRKK